MVQMGLLNVGGKIIGFDTPAPPVTGGGGGGGARGARGLQDAGDTEIGYAIEMQIQIKRAEREKKRKVRMMMMMMMYAVSEILCHTISGKEN